MKGHWLSRVAVGAEGSAVMRCDWWMERDERCSLSTARISFITLDFPIFLSQKRGKEEIKSINQLMFSGILDSTWVNSHVSQRDAAFQ